MLIIYDKLKKVYRKLSKKTKLWVFVLFIILLVIMVKGFGQYFTWVGNNAKAYITDDEIKNNKDKDITNIGSDSNNPKPKEVIIVIDPGHGGEDLGAYHEKLYEKDINLDISKKLGEKLEEKDIRVVYTRDDDTFIDLDPRVNIANDLEATLFISVHNNAMPDNSQYRGTETLYCPLVSEVERRMDGEKLALIVQKELVKTLNTIDNGIIQRPNLAVLRKTKMPAVIVEIAYISSSSDREKLKNEEFRQKAADALSNAVMKALEKMEANKDANGIWKVIEK